MGKGEYAHFGQPPNPENDAKSIEDLLAELGFGSVARNDRDQKELVRDLERFAENGEDAAVAILYYSGHSMEAGSENYLVPLDADASAGNLSLFAPAQRALR